MFPPPIMLGETSSAKAKYLSISLYMLRFKEGENFKIVYMAGCSSATSAGSKYLANLKAETVS